MCEKKTLEKIQVYYRQNNAFTRKQYNPLKSKKPLQAAPTSLLDEVPDTVIHGGDGASQGVGAHQLSSFPLHLHLHLSYQVTPITKSHGSHCITH